MKKGEIGRRIRAIRQDRKLSLRQVAATANLSATHISEIERGHTTPTVGALVRIADALGCETHFFLEPDWLPEVSIVRNGEAPHGNNSGPATGHTTPLTRGIPGGRLDCKQITYDPHSEPAPVPGTEGELAGYVLKGELVLTSGGESLELGEGDSFHLRADLPHRISNPKDLPAEVLVVSSQGLRTASR